MEYHDYVDALARDEPQLAREFQRFNALENVLDWMKGRGLDLGTIDLVTQDEYCHDMLIPLNGEGKHAVFGMT